MNITTLSGHIRSDLLYNQRAINKLFKTPDIMQCPSCGEIIYGFDICDDYINKCKKM